MSTPPERFFRAALRSMGPLLVWAAHFAFCYALIAFGCVAWGPQAPLRALVIGASVLAAAVIVLQGLRARRRRSSPLAAPAQRWAALLALLGVVWAAMPALVLPVCRFD
jgi:hypothetical protein